MRTRELGRVLCLGAFAVGSAAIFTPGCGGDDSTTIAGDDGGGDAAANDGSGGDVTLSDAAGNDSAIDSSTDSAIDSAHIDGGTDTGGGDSAADATSDATNDAANDAGSICPVDNAACSNGGSNGLCKSMACASCVDPTDDTNCSTAYGGGSGYLCLAGACSPGNCRATADCTTAAAPLCGIVQPNQCGKCTSDSQCAAANAALPVCNTTSGVCVASAGSCTGQADDATCTVNANDVCCSQACTAGNCCPGSAGDTFCKTLLSSNSAVCSAGHRCTTCDPVAGLNYVVDPMNGVDSSATGSGTSGGGTANTACAFKTITRALQAIGANPATGTTITIRNTAAVSVVGNGETFPINVTKNVVITATGGLVTVTPPANGFAFAFASSGSGINGTLGGGSMTIDGAQNTAFYAVVATTGSTDGTTLKNVTIQNFLREGVLATNAGILTINQGVVVKNNGTPTNQHPGLHVNGTAHVNINVATGLTQTSFNHNTQHGILVDAGGSVNILGIVTNGVSTVDASSNAVAGLDIATRPSGTLAPSVVNGLAVVGTTAGNGIRIEGGANVKVRNCYVLGNVGNGVLVTTSVVGLVRNNSLTNINLGKAGDPGLNTLQATVGNNANQNAGVCLQVDMTSGTLSAEGNLFSGGHNCSTTASVLTFSNAGCGANRDLGLAASQGTTVGNDIDVLMCTHP